MLVLRTERPNLLSYTYKFQVYTGKRLTPMTLMDGLFRQRYHLFCDNFYSSPKLCSDLFQRGCFNRNNTGKQDRLPKNLSNPLPAKEDRGTSSWFRDGQTAFVKWKDTKVVGVISSVYPAPGRDFIERGRGKLVGERYVKD